MNFIWRTLRANYNQYLDIFRETLNTEPALVTPLELTVDLFKWEQPNHYTSSQPQTPANRAEIKRQLDLLLQQIIIRLSTAPYYSQVHLAEKPPKGSSKKQFCIYYVLLNICTPISDQWPLPSIHQMLRRLGQSLPKYFAVFDLTSGYHWAPMSLAAIGLTAYLLLWPLWIPSSALRLKRRAVLFSACDVKCSTGWTDLFHLWGLHRWHHRSRTNCWGFLE